MRVAATVAFLLAIATATAGQSDAIDVADGSCGREVLIAVVGAARIHASCERDGAESVMHVSVTNLADAIHGAVRDVRIGFCGRDVISASAQSGWIVTISPEKDDVEWSLPESLAEELGVPSHARMGGFEVRLKPGWRRSRSAVADWRDSANAVATTHDCFTF
jgi:hypothetical protein